MSVFAVQGPGNALVESLDGDRGLLSDVAHDGVNHLALVVTLLALDNIFGRNTAFRQINVTCGRLLVSSLRLHS